MEGAESFAISRFGTTWNLVRLENKSTAPWPLISQSAYAISIGVVTGIALVIGIARTVFKLYRRGYCDLHDAVFSFALCCTLISAVLIVYAGPLFYAETELSFGAIIFTSESELVGAAVLILKIIYGVQDVQWVSIYSVKLCYLLFFYKLTHRLKTMRILWWIVLCFTMVVFIVTMCLPAFICTSLDENIFAMCSISDMNYRAAAEAKMVAALDIASDLLIISIPIILLSKTKIDLRRKITIGVILSLSCVMIAIALVRVNPPNQDSRVVDAAWYFFWIAFESAIAIIMVSITAFRSIFQSEAPSHKTPSDPLSSSKFGSRIATFFDAVKLRTRRSRCESTEHLYDSEKSLDALPSSKQTFLIDQSFGSHSDDSPRSSPWKVGNSTHITSQRGSQWV